MKYLILLIFIFLFQTEIHQSNLFSQNQITKMSVGKHIPTTYNFKGKWKRINAKKGQRDINTIIAEFKGKEAYVIYAPENRYNFQVGDIIIKILEFDEKTGHGKTDTLWRNENGGKNYDQQDINFLDENSFKLSYTQSVWVRQVD